MKKILFIMFFFLVLMTSQVEATTIVNGGFETGDLTGWTNNLPSGATTSIVNSWTIRGYHNVPTSNLYLPTEGDYFALLQTGGPRGLYANKLSQSFSAQAGDTLLFDIFFDTGDNYVSGGTEDTARAYVLDSFGAKVTGGDLFYWTMRMVGPGGETPWTNVNVVLPTAGDYTLMVELWKDIDDNYPSYVGLDNVVPEPGTVSLLALGLLVLRRRKSA